MLNVHCVSVERDRTTTTVSNITGTVNTIINCDLIHIKSQGSVISNISSESKAHIDRLFLFQRRSTHGQCSGTRRSNKPFFNLKTCSSIKGCDGSTYIGLSWCGRMEARGYRAPQCNSITQCITPCHFTINGATEV